MSKLLRCTVVFKAFSSCLLNAETTGSFAEWWKGGGYMKIKPVNWLIPGREQDQTGVAFALANSKETPAYP